MMIPESLPPLKRFTLLHPHHDPSLDDQAPPPPSFPLPSKKRKECRPPPFHFLTHPLPTKKRLWAPPPPPPDSPPLLVLNPRYEPCARLGFGSGLSVPEATVERPSVFPLFGEVKSHVAAGIGQKTMGDVLLPIPDSEAPEGIVEEGVPRSAAPEKRVLDEGEEISEEDEDDGILCVICQSTDGDPADPIVFCDGCNLMVHATCYGNPLIRGIPDGEWYCHRCLASSENGPAIACRLCPNMGGAMKPTVDGRWAHIVCAVFVPEVFFEDAEGREGVNCRGIEGRKYCSKRCCVCRGRSGCLVECSERRCKRGFHVTCGLEEDLWLDYKQGRGKAVVAGFCREHTELWKKQQRTGKFKIVSRDDKV